MDTQDPLFCEVCPCCRRPGCQAYRALILTFAQRLAALEEVNASLAASATMFGDLAERLNERILQERAGPD